MPENYPFTKNKIQILRINCPYFCPYLHIVQFTKSNGRQLKIKKIF